MALYPLLRPLIFTLDAERAHRLTIRALQALPAAGGVEAQLPVRVAGIDFPNPVGLAPGFDKNAEVFAQAPRLGFGFVEVGTLTPQPQAGNPKPRLFRLAEDGAVINRMGFNNDGIEAALARLQKPRAGIVGVNIGANKDSADRIADYAVAARAMAPVADYLTVNISSPNTPGLRALQDSAALEELMAPVIEVPRRQAGVRQSRRRIPNAPTFVDIVTVASIEKSAALIVSNTTVGRPPLRSTHRHQPGGLSGAPLKLLRCTSG